MRYVSTRNAKAFVSASEAITRGLAEDGGLYLPESIPALEADFVARMTPMSYPERAAFIMKKYLDEFMEDELLAMAKAAYASFDDPDVAPTRVVAPKTGMLELWHGPTCAFKDMALQMLPRLLTASMRKNGDTRRVMILVATSGDTGKAALEGFRDVEGTSILVFYPRDGVSDVQKLQMTSQEGGNVGVCGVLGNFDDAQNGVKAIFSDEKIRAELASSGTFLSSANSINWGRQLPQIAYYVSAYCDMVSAGEVKAGEKLDFCVPTGNFGDILAGWYAMRMGVPVGKLICASNSNRVLTDLFETGVYDRRRKLMTTVSPSMDILISSNLERLLFEESGKDDALVRRLMGELGGEGIYSLPESLKNKLAEEFAAGCCTEDGTKAAIGEVWKSCGTLIDTHTAVAWHVLEEYRKKTGSDRPAVVVSTASPYKFCAAVIEGLGSAPKCEGTDAIFELAELTGTEPPAPLAALRGKKPIHTGFASKEEMPEVVLRFGR
ncbi:MAG: threonine synthase [Oscillospiraceae bacterium]|nr:threonine synthase [Oscillospiraceae bacterium]